jgi:hypothetical protein
VQNLENTIQARLSTIMDGERFMVSFDDKWCLKMDEKVPGSLGSIITFFGVFELGIHTYLWMKGWVL